MTALRGASRRAGWRRCRWALALAACFAAGASAGAAPAGAERWLARDWRQVELVLFRHRRAQTDERLARYEPRRYARRLLTLKMPPTPERLGASELVQRCVAWRAPAPTPAVGAALLPTAPLWLDPAPAAALAADPNDAPPPTPVESARMAFAEFEQRLTRRRSQWLQDGLALADAVARMRRSGAYDVLGHGRWLQALPRRARPAPLLAQFGERLPGGAYEVEGTVSVARGRYINLNVELLAPEPPPPGEAWQLERDGYALFAQTRRVRNGELHYLDHPRFGAVVRVSRLALPEALAALAEAAKESLQ